MKLGVSAAASPMRLGGTSRSKIAGLHVIRVFLYMFFIDVKINRSLFHFCLVVAYQTDGWDLDDSEWGNGEDGWDNDWTSKPSSQNSSSSSQSTSTNVVAKEEKAAEMHKRREERRQV